MLPFTLPNSSSSDASLVEVTSPSKAPSNFSLNGLFGESTGFDEQVSIPFTPPAGSVVYGKRPTTSPCISPTNQSLSQHQPILLSDLADNTGGSLNYTKKILCSFVSPYDNCRCTNLSITMAEGGKSFCQKHLHIANGLSGSTCSTFLTPIPQQTLQQGLSLQNPMYKVPGYSPAPNNVPTTPKSLSQPQKQINQQNAAGMVTPLVSASTHKTKNNTLTNSQHMAINGDVLRTVVDMLNKNRRGLTTKQQIKLLNSLGVIVATVKNPADLQNGGVAMAQPSVAKQQGVNNNSSLQDQSALQQQSQNLHRSILHQQNALKSAQGNSFLVDENVNATITAQRHSTLKRKGGKSKGGGAKKAKQNATDREGTSLQHLSAVELDVKVSEALASVGGMKNGLKQNLEPPVIDSKPKVTKSTPVAKNSKKQSRNASQPPLSVAIPPNPAFLSKLTAAETVSKHLKRYVVAEREKLLSNCSLFPLGPFCDDLGHEVCVCEQAQYKLDASRVKKKTFGKLALGKKCPFCNKRGVTEASSLLAISTTTLSGHCVTEFTGRLGISSEMDNFRYSKCASSSETWPSTRCEELAHSSKPNPSIRHTSKPTFSTATDSSAEDVSSIPPLLSQVGDKPEADSSKRDSPLEDNTWNESKLAASAFQSHCSKFVTSARRFKREATKEKQSLRLLMQAAKTHHKETAKALQSLGNDHVTAKHLPGSLLHRTCQLAGQNCVKASLPCSNYCVDHIWHCSLQQIFKLNSDMGVVPDISPEPASVKPRKKTKLPPLSKKKKRKPRKNASVFTSNLVKSTSEALDEPLSKQIKLESNEPGTSKGTRSDSFVSVDDSEQNPGENSTEPAVDDDGVLDAFNIDSTGFMDDMMPDLLQEFGLFAGRNSDVLDNALLLAGAVDSEYPGQFAEDDLGDSPLLFPQSAAGQSLVNMSTPLSPGDSDYANLPCSSTSGSSQAPRCSDMLASGGGASILTSSQDGTAKSGLSSDGSYGLSEPIWPDCQEIQNEVPLSTPEAEPVKPELSLSRDSFADDLRELEGVLESLQEEFVEESQPSENIPAVTSTVSISSAANVPLTFSDNTPVHSTATVSTDPQVTTPVVQMIELRKQHSTPKKSKQGTKKSKKSVAVASTTHQGKHLGYIQTNAPLTASARQVIEQQLESGKISSKPIAEVGKAKSGRKSRCTYPVPGYISASTPMQTHTSPGQQPLRVQPKLLPGNLLCSSGKLPSSLAASGMVLIPVNAFVQPGNQTALNQGIGLTLTMAPGQGFPTTIGTMIPVRGPNVVGNPGNQQQYIIVNGAQLTNQVTLGNGNNNQRKGKKTKSTLQTVPTPIFSPPNSVQLQQLQQPQPQQQQLQQQQQQQQHKQQQLQQLNKDKSKQQQLNQDRVKKQQQQQQQQLHQQLQQQQKQKQQQQQQMLKPQQQSPPQQHLQQQQQHVKQEVQLQQQKQQQHTEQQKQKQDQQQQQHQQQTLAPNQQSTPQQQQKQQPRSDQQAVVSAAPASSEPKFNPAASSSKSKDSTISNPRKHQPGFSPLVIPPAATATLTPGSSGSTLTPATPTPTRKNTKASGTVHWNQTTPAAEGAPPLPQQNPNHRGPYGSVGGQTSNMLYCRRISPSFNSSQHVIVGRLGSLGHMGGLSRLAVNERLSQYQKQQQFAENRAKTAKTVSAASVSASSSSPEVVLSRKDFAPGFINIAHSCRPSPNPTAPVAPAGKGVSHELPGDIAAKRQARKSGHIATLTDPDQSAETENAKSVSTPVCSNLIRPVPD